MPLPKSEHINAPVAGTPSLGARLLPKSLGKKKERFTEKELFILSVLTMHVVLHWDSLKAHHYKNLTRDWLVATLTTRFYKVTMDRLREFGLIEAYTNAEGRDSYSTLYHSSKQFRLTKALREEVVAGHVEHFIPQDQKLYRRLEKWNSNTTTKLIEGRPWLADERERLKQLLYDAEGAESMLESIRERREFRGNPLTAPVFNSLLHHHHQLQKYFSGSGPSPHLSVKHGRVFHPLTHCNREFRKYIIDPEGERFAELDLKSAQWVFLCKAIGIAHLRGWKDRLWERLEGCVEDDVDLSVIQSKGGLHAGQLGAFFRAVFTMDIYSELEWLSDADGYVKLSGEQAESDARAEAKQQCIASTLFGYHRDRGVSQWSEAQEKHVSRSLARNYPLVLQFIQTMAKESKNRNRPSSDLAKLMQRMEGHFFHRIAGPSLSQSYPHVSFFIVHDAVYVPCRYKWLVEGVFPEALEQHLGWPGQWS
jgi:hypothetical protein